MKNHVAFLSPPFMTKDEYSLLAKPNIFYGYFSLRMMVYKTDLAFYINHC